MATLVKTTQDGRKVEVIGQAVTLGGKLEAVELIPVADHPNRAGILHVMPDAVYMAGRIALTKPKARSRSTLWPRARRNSSPIRRPSRSVSAMRRAPARPNSKSNDAPHRRERKTRRKKNPPRSRSGFFHDVKNVRPKKGQTRSSR